MYLKSLLPNWDKAKIRESQRPEMFFDMNLNSMIDQMIVFPDFVFTGLPRPEPLTEIDIINANNTSTININASIED